MRLMRFAARTSIAIGILGVVRCEDLDHGRGGRVDRSRGEELREEVEVGEVLAAGLLGEGEGEDAGGGVVRGGRGVVLCDGCGEGEAEEVGGDVEGDEGVVDVDLDVGGLRGRRCVSGRGRGRARGESVYVRGRRGRRR